MEKRFEQLLEERIRKSDSLLCVGLDPRPADVNLPDFGSYGERTGARPENSAESTSRIYDNLVEWGRRLIAETAEYTAAYKPNSAFYEAFGAAGVAALEAIIALVPADIPVILDCKRGDIGSTAQAYAEAAFGRLRADAVTLNPYMGKDAIAPFLQDARKGAFVLVKTSNPGSADMQTIVACKNNNGPGRGGCSVFEHTARLVDDWNAMPDIAGVAGAVVGATDLESLERVRQKHPDMWILCPGIGAQGGSLEESLLRGLRADGSGVLPVVARGITQADSPAEAAKSYRDAIRKVRTSFAGSGSAALGNDSPVSKEQALNAQICKGLVEEECFRTGQFTLKSGIVSPFYIDLRRVVRSPKLLRLVAKAYASAVKGLKFDRIAGIPVAALPLATAVSLETGIPMIYPRMEKKKHGTGNRIEGGFVAGERILLLDDLITTGGSKIEAVEILREAGLVVEDLVVLLERGSQGRQEMTAAGMELHSCMQLDEVFLYCREAGVISPEQEAQMREFAAS